MNLHQGLEVQVKYVDIRAAKDARRKFDARVSTTYGRAESCPLAFALKRIFPGWQFSVRPTFIVYNREGAIYDRSLHPLPDSVCEFILVADENKDRIRPRTVTL